MQLKKVLSLLDLIILLTKFSIDIYTNNTYIIILLVRLQTKKHP